MELIEGKKVLELVPAGRPLKGGAVERIVADAAARRRALRGRRPGRPQGVRGARPAGRSDGLVTVKVAVHGPETPAALTATADVVVDGPAGLVGLLRRL